MRQARIDVLAVLVEHGVGKVVVLVDDEVERHAVLPGHGTEEIQLLGSPVPLLHIIGESLIEQTFIATGKAVDDNATIAVEVGLQLVDSSRHLREVEVQHGVAVAIRRGMAPYPQLPEVLVEAVLLVDVVVAFQHAQQQ